MTSRAPDTTPVIAWLGTTPPDGAIAGLAPVATIKTRWTPEARLLVVWSPAGIEQLGRLPARTRRPPVIAASDVDPTHRDRMEWIRAGADDLVALSALPGVVASRLQSPPAPSRSSPRPGIPASPGGARPLADRGTRTLPRPASRQPATAPADAFPPLRVPQPEGGIPASATAWVQGLQRYLPQRDEWTSRWGRGGLDRLLELAQLRARAEGGSADFFGVAAGRNHESISWPMFVRRGPSRGRKGIAVAEVQAIARGSDGLVIEAPFAVAERQKIVADLQVHPDECAQMLLEARWQRRIAGNRWHIGLLVAELRMRSLPGT